MWNYVENTATTGANEDIYRTTIAGAFANVGGDDAIAIGYSAQTENPQSMAIGSESSALLTIL